MKIKDRLWPLNINNIFSWKSSFFPLGCSAGKFKANHLYRQSYFFPFHSLLCFSSFPSLLNCHLSSHIDWTLHFFLGREFTRNVQCSVHYLSVCPGSCLHETVPLLSTSWQWSLAKAFGAKAWEQVEAEARLPSGRSSTLERSSITDKDIPHLSFSSSSTLQGQLCFS